LVLLLATSEKRRVDGVLDILIDTGDFICGGTKAAAEAAADATRKRVDANLMENGNEVHQT
jgi:hypothetical protein